MVAAKKTQGQTNTQSLVDIQVDIGVLKSQQTDTVKTLTRIEDKIDAMTYVKQADFDQFKKDVFAVLNNKVDSEAFRPVKAIVFGAVGIILAAVMTALLALIRLKG